MSQFKKDVTNSVPFCVVPYTRGQNFLEYQKKYTGIDGFSCKKVQKEIHLLGQNVNAYHGKSSNGDKVFSLADLIHTIFQPLGGWKESGIPPRIQGI